MDMFVTITLISFHVLFPYTTVSDTMLWRNMVLENTTDKNQNVPAQGTMDDSYCSYHRVCGANGNCDINKAPPCVCLEGFIPNSTKGWNAMDYTQGCVRNKALNCATDGFNKYGSGCKLWTGDLFDVRVIKGGGQDLYIRMPASELDPEDETHGLGKRRIVRVIIGSIFTIMFGMILGVGCCYMHRKRTNLEGNRKTAESNEQQKEDLELPIFNLSRIAEATNNFSVNNKLGEGGFGPVYKGTLDDGQQIAVKRLSSKYAVNGQFSTKSDVFSFGILLLEIITGKKIRGCYYTDENDIVNLYGHAWNLWKQGRSLELIDECLKDSYTLSQVQRCIHISLLCAQQHPHDRPSMSTVVLMLGSQIDLPQIKSPTFLVGEPNSDATSSSCSKNELSITVLEPR
ncbi:hypothetical protein VNO77_28341 [Canavalia gladiata]|uniref:Uncharacterized protein n=1 Tax=Canavalia gladiata TaxID=3824 RepID=A0AAN9KVH4_CANGL